MFDVWLGDGLLLLAVPAYYLSAILRLKPRLLPGEGVHLIDLEALQADYQKRYPVRLCLWRVLPAALALYFGVRLILWPPGFMADGPPLAPLLITAFALFILSIIGATVLRTRHERAFVKAHPAFQDSLLPVPPRILAVLPWVLAFGAVVGGFIAEDKTTKFLLLGMGFLGLLIGGRVRSRQITHSRYELPWDEPLGNAISEVVERFGRTPKKLVLLPSLVANAVAMPDGSVIVTSALRTISTPAEVVAHELSHVRDGEGKKLSRFRMISAIPIGLIVCIGIWLGTGTPFEPLVPPLAGFGAMTLSMLTTWWFCKRTQPMEFKCDADAARLGVGPELAGCLDKITRFMGMPPRWIGIDRYLLTHPSLEERVARLHQISSEPLIASEAKPEASATAEPLLLWSAMEGRQTPPKP
jgi:Zn-dependent protease with chaperone function